MSDYQLRARISNELAEKIKKIAGAINSEVPEAEVTISNIARYALQEYSRRFNLDIEGETLFLEIPIKDMQAEQLNVILRALEDIQKVSPAVGNGIEQVENKILDLEVQKLLSKRKLKGGE